MPAIHTLPQEIITRIAAGQVVERPASVVKELVENSLDAKARRIEIRLTDGGISALSVSDDGVGMEEADLQRCFLPHTTSKIMFLDDLGRVATFGFRGEALASLVSVSRVTIESRPADAVAGMQAVLENGELISLRPQGMPYGTRVKVEGLFAQVPARQKFLSSPQGELKRVLREVSSLALANPSVEFILFHQDQLLFHVLPTADPAIRVQEVLGEQLANHLLPIAIESEHAQITGFLGKPQIATTINRHQYAFVNGRRVIQPELVALLKDTYGTLLEPRVQPTFVLFLTVPPDTVDVNIHPRKETVRIVHWPSLRDQLAEAVAMTLEQTTTRYTQTAPRLWQLNDSGMAGETARVLKKQVKPWQAKTTQSAEIGQFHNLYLIAETAEGLLLIDQHAAHERILYEQYLATWHALTPTSVQLAEAIEWQVGAAELTLLQEYQDNLVRLGFEIGLSEDGLVTVTAVPELFADRELSQLLAELVDAWETTGQPPASSKLTLDVVTRKTLSYLACRAAIKAGDPLTLEERQRLLEKLAQTKTQYTCPHGRPVQLEITLPELERLFKRRQ